MYYVYILLSLKDKKFYIGFTSNLKLRLVQHKSGKVNSTSKRLPVKLIYYECYLKESDARRNEKYYKTSKGKIDLKKKLKDILGL
jgi:putative endonuclease